MIQIYFLVYTGFAAQLQFFLFFSYYVACYKVNAYAVTEEKTLFFMLQFHACSIGVKSKGGVKY